MRLSLGLKEIELEADWKKRWFVTERTGRMRRVRDQEFKY